MKVKKIAVGSLAISLFAIAFVSTVIAAADYSPFYDATRQGNILTLTITSEYSDTEHQFPGSAIDTSRITLVMLPRGETETQTYLVPSETQFTVTQYGVIFTLDRRDLPVKFVAESWVTGYIKIDTTWYTFEAAGPGWGWANIH